jgi:hypothetical protein
MYTLYIMRNTNGGKVLEFATFTLAFNRYVTETESPDGLLALFIYDPTGKQVGCCVTQGNVGFCAASG